MALNEINVEALRYVVSFRDNSTQNPPRNANPPHYPPLAERRHLPSHPAPRRARLPPPSATQPGVTAAPAGVSGSDPVSCRGSRVASLLATSLSAGSERRSGGRLPAGCWPARPAPAPRRGCQRTGPDGRSGSVGAAQVRRGVVSAAAPLADVPVAPLAGTDAARAAGLAVGA